MTSLSAALCLSLRQVGDKYKQFEYTCRKTDVPLLPNPFPFRDDGEVFGSQSGGDPGFGFSRAKLGTHYDTFHLPL